MIINREQLLEYLDGHASMRSIRRALDEGGIEFLGGFHYIPPTGYPGWIIKVTSRFKKTWIVTIVPFNYKYNINIINEIPWEYWDGENSTNPLYTGDNPEKYKNEKMAAIQRRA